MRPILEPVKAHKSKSPTCLDPIENGKYAQPSDLNFWPRLPQIENPKMFSAADFRWLSAAEPPKNKKNVKSPT